MIPIMEDASSEIAIILFIFSVPLRGAFVVVVTAPGDRILHPVAGEAARCLEKMVRVVNTLICGICLHLFVNPAATRFP